MFSEEWKVPVGSDCDLNHNVLTHVLCTLFIVASCLDSEETWLKPYSLSFSCQNQMCVKGGLSKQAVFIFGDHRFCLLRELKQRRHGRGRQAGMGEDCDPALGKMCPLSESERQADRQRQGVWPAANVLKKTLPQTHIMSVKSVCKAILVKNTGLSEPVQKPAHADSSCENPDSLTRFHY